jgi:ABC-2 type transport system ATP-binding protein
MNSTPIVAVDDLRKRYRTGLFRRRTVDALKGVSLQVESGEIFGLLGPNGAGKTTLIKILLGIVKRSSGSASVLGFPAGDRRGRLRIGYLPESHRIPRHLTGHLALEYYGQLSHLTLKEIRAKRGALLDSVGLSKWGNHSVKGYSKGMLQRLGLAQAMLHDPDLLILDEPTDGVDPVGRAEIRDVLFQLKEQGRTIFLNSHLLHELELVCDRVAILTQGLVRHVGGVRELTEEASSELQLQVRGERTTVESLFCESGVTIVVSGGRRPEDGLTLTLQPDGQADVDRVVDTLRAGGVSIESMTRPGRSLEQVFLSMIAADEAASEERATT